MKRFIVMAVLILLCAGLACPADANEPLAVSGRKQEAKLVNRVMPVYPPEAKKAGIEGKVKLSVIIDAKGNVSKVDVVSGRDELTKAAVDAVSQWRYEPTYLNGKPVAVKTDVDVNFVLEHKK